MIEKDAGALGRLLKDAGVLGDLEKTAGKPSFLKARIRAGLNTVYDTPSRIGETHDLLIRRPSWVSDAGLRTAQNELDQFYGKRFREGGRGREALADFFGLGSRNHPPLRRVGATEVHPKPLPAGWLTRAERVPPRVPAWKKEDAWFLPRSGRLPAHKHLQGYTDGTDLMRVGKKKIGALAVESAAFREALRKYAQAAPAAADVLLSRTGLNPDMVKGYGGLAQLLLGAVRFPRYSYPSRTSLWHAMEMRGRRF